METGQSLLLSFAHPDDESFFAAGVSCMYSGHGVRIAVVTATLGEEAKLGDPPVATRDELPAIREGELRAAAQLLGIGQVYLLGYRDRALADAPTGEIRERLVRAIREHRPLGDLFAGMEDDG